MTNDLQQDATFIEMWSQLNQQQKDYVVARLQHPTKTSAAEAIGIDRTSVYRWPQVVEACVAYVQAHALQSAYEMLQTGLHKAITVKLSGLEAGEGKLRQSVATEIIERFMGKARQEVELNHSGSVETQVQVYLPQKGA